MGRLVLPGPARGRVIRRTLAAPGDELAAVLDELARHLEELLCLVHCAFAVCLCGLRVVCKKNSGVGLGRSFVKCEIWFVVLLVVRWMFRAVGSIEDGELAWQCYYSLARQLASGVGESCHAQGPIEVETTFFTPSRAEQSGMSSLITWKCDDVRYEVRRLCIFYSMYRRVTLRNTHAPRMINECADVNISCLGVSNSR